MQTAAVADPAEVEAFRRDGFVCLKGLLEPAEVRRLREASITHRRIRIEIAHPVAQNSKVRVAGIRRAKIDFSHSCADQVGERLRDIVERSNQHHSRTEQALLRVAAHFWNYDLAAVPGDLSFVERHSTTISGCAGWE